MFNEICIYEAKIDKQEEIETLMKEVAKFYLSQPGVIDVKYIKHTHRQEDFNAVKEGKPAIRLTKWIGKKSHILCIGRLKTKKPTRVFQSSDWNSFTNGGIDALPQAQNPIRGEYNMIPIKTTAICRFNILSGGWATLTD